MHHPPDKEQGYDAKYCVGDPVAGGFGFPEIKHRAMVAGVLTMLL
jgi:hypothetical protein